MVAKIFAVLVILLIVAGAFIAMRSDEFHVTRSIIINEPAGSIFEQINEERNWKHWLPWRDIEPSTQVTYEGTLSAIPATLCWDTDNNSNVGFTTITASHPNDFIQLRLDFLNSQKITNLTEIRLEPQGNNVLVTWNMAGKMSFDYKAINLVFDCEKMIGDQFEKGLRNIQFFL